MGIFTGFEKGSHGSYMWDEQEGKWVKKGDAVRDPNQGLNGPVWFPKGGTKYFDKALNREFSSLSEKKNYLREHKLCMAGDSKEHKGVQAKGVGSTYYSYPGIDRCSRGYLNR